MQCSSGLHVDECIPPVQLSINVNVNSRTQDSNLLTPLLMAVQSAAAASAISAGGGGGEAAAVAGAPEDIIVRNLLLAGASVTARNTSEQGGAISFSIFLEVINCL